jgi:ferredoxin
MKASVDQKLCGTVGMCVKTAPEIFRFQEGSKKARVVMEEIPLELEAKCRRAAAACPNRAVVITDS